MRKARPATASRANPRKEKFTPLKTTLQKPPKLTRRLP